MLIKMETRIYAAPAVKGLTIEALHDKIKIFTHLKMSFVAVTHNFKRVKLLTYIPGRLCTI